MERWDGLSERERRPLRSKFQYVPQDSMSALNPQQTALEHITETYQVLGGKSASDAQECSGNTLVGAWTRMSDYMHCLERCLEANNVE